MDSREKQNLAEVRLQQLTWSSQLKVDRAAIPWNALIKEFQRSHFTYVAKALEQPFLLPKDMDAVRNLKQQNLFSIPKKGPCYGKFIATHFLFIKY